MSRRRRAPTTDTADRQPARFTRFRTIPLGAKARIEVDLVDVPGGRSLSIRPWLSKGRDRPIAPGEPLRVSAAHLAALISALTDAAAELGEPLPDPSPHGTRRRPTKDTTA